MTALRLTFAFCVAAGAVTAAAAESYVTLPPGDTYLADIAIARVGRQSYGQPPVLMPVGWQGTEEVSGVVYLDDGYSMGRRSIFMHSPWRVPPGKAWVDYPLALPKSAVIALKFGIAIATEAVGKSDGVTFSCYLMVDGRQKKLMRQHYAQDKWRDYSFDLSPYAGQKVVVRLQVEPGPRNDTNFDHSHFGDAKITLAGGAYDRASLVKRLVDTAAYRAREKVGLARLVNRSDRGVTPGNLLPCTTRFEAAHGAYRFVYQGDDGRVVYRYQPTSGTLDDFTVQLDDGPSFQPAAGGWATAVVKSNGKTKEIALRGGRLVHAALNQNVLQVVWEYSVEGGRLPIAWTFRLVGKAIEVAARCDEPVISRFSLGEVGGVALRRNVIVPYLLGRVVYLPVENAFACRYLDWTQSHSSSCPQGDAAYEAKTDGTRNPMSERGYFTVSRDFDEVLPNTPSPRSPYLSVLGPRIMLDTWGHYKGTYQGDAENLLALKDEGVDHLAIIQHVWQRYGYDVKLPDHMPANPQFGGDAGMIAYGKAANACGYLWSLHENYIDLYPDAPSYDPTARVLMSDGSPAKAWYNAGTGVQSFGLKCNRALGFARRNSPEAHRRYATTAAYLDVHTCVPPWHELDHEAGQPMAAMEQAKMKYDTELFQFMRDTHGGPLFGEGHWQFYWAGRCDGVEGQVDGGEDHAALLDFDLLKIHPQMVNHGMGYYERWFRNGYQHRWGRDSGTMEQIDKYRAQELAYGHAGFVGADQVANRPWVIREHHLMHPVQRLYATARPVEIRYEVEGRLVDAGIALAVGDTSRQRVRYDNGLTLWVNWRGQPWQVEGRTLPQWGFLALGPDTEVSTTLRGGRWADYAECPEYVFADARTWFPMPYRHPPKKIEPRLLHFKYLGGDRAEVTYEWIVNDRLKSDYTCFVHAVPKDDPNPNHIEFQQDHGLPKPTSKWRPGETIIDGPYQFRVPAKTKSYDLTIGLYQDRRVMLTGVEKDGNRILLARLNVQEHGGKVTGITAERVRYDPRVKPRQPGLDFTARLNPPGTWIDFGRLATDGAVKINRQSNRLVLFPYPRDKPFRVAVDVKGLAPAADTAAIQVHALAAGSGQDLGPVAWRMENRRLMLTVGKPGAGRYAIIWK